VRDVGVGHAQDPLIPTSWRDGEVAVLGLGRTGVAASTWLVKQGLRVYASDSASDPRVQRAAQSLRDLGVSVDVGRHDLDRVRRAAAVIVSPGISPDAEPIRVARDAAREVIAEVDVATRALQNIRVIAVTGTNGKSTTTALIDHILRHAGFRSVAAGNIGRPLIDLATSEAQLDWVVAEISSYQLHDSPHLEPEIGVLTNLAPDHLDRYGSVAAYYADKRLLFRNATPASRWVVNGDDAAAQAMARGVPGLHTSWSLLGPADAWYDRGADVLRLDATVLLPRSELPLLGDHNVENALAAALASRAADVSPDLVAEALRLATPLPHRLESVREAGGVLWINDSKATNVSSAQAALRAIDRPFLLLAGGQGKGEDFGQLVVAMGDRCRHVIAFGRDGRLIEGAVASTVPVIVVETLTAAVDRAVRMARPGDVVLLSPACASFDQFENYEDRGNTFKSLVEAL